MLQQCVDPATQRVHRLHRALHVSDAGNDFHRFRNLGEQGALAPLPGVRTLDVDPIEVPVECVQERDQRVQVLLLRKGTTAHVPQAEVRRASHTRHVAEGQRQPRDDVVDPTDTQHQLDGLCRCVELDLARSRRRQVAHLRIDDCGQVRQLRLDAWVGHEGDGEGERRGHRCLVEGGLDGAFTPEGKGVAGAPWGLDVPFDGVHRDALVAGAVVAPLHTA